MSIEILDIGYVYQITSDEDDKIYYGSTKNWKERIRSHNSIRNQCMTNLMVGRKIIKVLEQHNNISRTDLKEKERKWIQNHNESTSNLLLLNKQIPNQSQQEYHKKRYAKKSIYYAAKQKVYYWENQSKELQRNKDYLSKRKGDTWFCVDCNNLYSWTTKKSHIKTLKHISNASNCVAAATTTESVALEDGSVDSPTTDTAFC